MEQMILIIFRLSDRYYYLKTHKQLSTRFFKRAISPLLLYSAGHLYLPAKRTEDV